MWIYARSSVNIYWMSSNSNTAIAPYPSIRHPATTLLSEDCWRLLTETNGFEKTSMTILTRLNHKMWRKNTWHWTKWNNLPPLLATSPFWKPHHCLLVWQVYASAIFSIFNGKILPLLPTKAIACVSEHRKPKRKLHFLSVMKPMNCVVRPIQVRYSRDWSGVWLTIRWKTGSKRQE